MDEVADSLSNPRWWSEGRNSKAKAIVVTLLLHSGSDIGRDLWLDVGCGNGEIAKYLALQARRVVGVDPDPWREWPVLCEESPGIAFHKGTYADLEGLLGKNSVDVVVCNQVYEHVEDPVALIHSIYQVLKPGGLCYFAGPNLLWPIEPHICWPFVHWLPRKLAHALMRMLGSRRMDRFDAFSWTYWRLTREFGHAGFEHAVAIRGRLMAAFYAKDMRRMAKIIGRLPNRLFSYLAWCSPGFAFVLKKTR